MPNLNVVAILKAKPGSEAIVEDALRALVGPSRSDHGCISYELFASESTPGTFVTRDGSRHRGHKHNHEEDHR